MKGTLLITLLLFIFSCKERSSTLSNQKKNDTTTYTYNGYHNFMKLMLFSNKKFKYTYQDHPELGQFKVTGNYVKFDKSISLKPLDYEKCIYVESNDTFRFNCTKLKNGHKIKTQYDILEWKNNNYLLSEESDFIHTVNGENDDYQRFINYYNQGFEPIKHGKYLISKTKKTNDLELDKDVFPKKYRKLLLDKPIIANIISIDKKEDDKSSFYLEIKIDKGANDNVSVGLTFLDDNDSCYITITNVLKNESIGRTGYYGDISEVCNLKQELRTRWNKHTNEHSKQP